MATLLASRPTISGSFLDDATTTSSKSRSPALASMSNSIVAGYTAGAFGVIVGQPLDCLKVYAQTQTPTQTLKRASLSSTVARIRTLYAGFQGPLVLVGMVQSVNFVVYDSLRQSLYQKQQQQQQQQHSLLNITSQDYRTKDPIQNVLLASTATGALISFLTSPFLVVKTHQQLYQQGFAETVSFLWARSAGSFYVGFGPHFVTETVGRALYFGTYESLKRATMALKQKQQSGKKKSLSLPERMLCAGLAGMASCVAVYPFDTLKSRIYAAASSRMMALPLMQQLPLQMPAWEPTTSSIRSLYRGFGVTILRSGPVAAAVLPLYDITVEYLGSNQ